MLGRRYGTKRCKFIDLRHTMLQENLKNNRVIVKHVPAAEQKADRLTKPLTTTAGFPTPMQVVNNHAR